MGSSVRVDKCEVEGGTGGGNQVFPTGGTATTPFRHRFSPAAKSQRPPLRFINRSSAAGGMPTCLCLLGDPSNLSSSIQVTEVVARGLASGDEAVSDRGHHVVVDEPLPLQPPGAAEQELGRLPLDVLNDPLDDLLTPVDH